MHKKCEKIYVINVDKFLKHFIILKIKIGPKNIKFCLLCFKKAAAASVKYVKSVRVRSYSGPYFPAFGLNAEQNNSEHGHFLRSGKVVIFR